ncbi:hypothetical protein E2C01_070989 [Portunus trituberculatus]|uniref:Uncharacterized protein n=1 Tax=Portunus trituberculatus TaxID=210409 RepID=A0A5B7I2U5_PORTR|nr:hypothetical protein [Portunus trituberculatus]
MARAKTDQSHYIDFSISSKHFPDAGGYGVLARSRENSQLDTASHDPSTTAPCHQSTHTPTCLTLSTLPG